MKILIMCDIMDSCCRQIEEELGQSCRNADVVEN